MSLDELVHPRRDEAGCSLEGREVSSPEPHHPSLLGSVPGRCFAPGTLAQNFLLAFFNAVVSPTANRLPASDQMLEYLNFWLLRYDKRLVAGVFFRLL